ncbi:uncharacterized protein LOC123715529 [Pieris brassicae]|uniref:uncharacterized protein LOC123715529 n=1 Tax=Pieris brassicae TaxID=7116 RepID=UPI001E660248|nr:uncharacterized protein LOC123715529 [Pieris brassicae]XP_045526536.1 uncharacterized protein LOC123715529 [Pieris brassicae]
MSGKLLLPTRKYQHTLARVATERAPCCFCKRDVDDELLYGKLYAIGEIHCHYFCVLLSCCLIQHGKDEEGLFGFLYPDILAEVERSKKHKCSYCMKEGATLGCSKTQCRKQFHLPCGRDKNAVSMFYGNFKSFCQQHVPKQKLPNNILDNIKNRKVKMKKSKVDNDLSEDIQEMVCVICYESVDAFPTIHTFWPPCCARDAWFHRSCVQRMALSAGAHYLRCPLCNDKERFYDAVLSQGYYVPNRDASWELEQNAFAEIYERTIVCSVPECVCPNGRDHDLEIGPWDIKLCLLCGNVGAHAHCAELNGHIYVCPICLPAAPDDPKYLEAIHAITLPEPNQPSRVQHGPRMPSRMSIRRTKPRLRNVGSSSNTTDALTSTLTVHSQNSITSRQELNLKTPSRPKIENSKMIDNGNHSPVKLFKQQLCEMNVLDNFEWDSDSVIELVREKLMKPKPLSIRKKIISFIIDSILNEKLKPNIKSPIKEWKSLKNEVIDVEMKSLEENNIAQEVNESIDKNVKLNKNLENIDCDWYDKMELNHEDSTGISIAGGCEDNILNVLTEDFLDKNLPIVSAKSNPVLLKNDSSMEISENNQQIDINVTQGKINKTIALKISPTKEVLGENINIDLEIFKNHYLNEVGGDNLYKTDDLPMTECAIESKTKRRDKKYRNLKKHRKQKKYKKDREHRNLDRDKDIDKHRNNDYKKNKNHKPKTLDNTGVVLKFLSEEVNENKEKRKTELSIRNKNIKVNIEWKKEKFKIKITNEKRKKQHANNYVFENAKNKIKMTPGIVSRVKRKYEKTEKFTDKLKQTSLDNFFTVKSPEK